MTPLFRASFGPEPDLIEIRRVTRTVTRVLGYDYRDQIRIATGVSELVRAALDTDRRDGGSVELAVIDDTEPQLFAVSVSGAGLAAAPGSSAYASAAAAERLLDRFARASADEPTTWRACRALPADTPRITPSRVAVIRAQLAPAPRDRDREELERQTRDLSAALLELDAKQQELVRLNTELADTNRGVMALYAELDERANHLRRANELKSRFFSYISHEFRTPLSSIVALSRLLLGRTDGELNDEQDRQVRLIRDSASELLDLVGNLLDLAKADAGKVDVTVTRFSLVALFGALRGMIRPLLGTSSVRLEFAPVERLPPLITDEGKLAQILRNFLSNAVKFTERGEITVTAAVVPAGTAPAPGRDLVAEESVLFCVSDTGIGIRPEDQGTIFDEFSQVRHGLQRRVRGTGLGLSLCRKLAALLGGDVWMTSAVGRGSQFYCLVPRVHRRAEEEGGWSAVHGVPLLLVAGDTERLALLENAFADTPFHVVPVVSGELTEERVGAIAPVGAVVDAHEGCSPDELLLRRLQVPILAGPLRGEPVDALVPATYRAAAPGRPGCVLVVDDDRRFLTVIERSLHGLCDEVVATEDPHEALAVAGDGRADCAILDLLMPSVDGFELLARLRAGSQTAKMPIVICSSKALTPEERTLLHRQHTSFIAKDELVPERLEIALLEARLSAAALERVPLDGSRGAEVR